MPGAAWPWKYTWSPAVPSSLPRKKWLNPTSYSEADDANVARWPPMPSEMWLARVTMTAAFHRMKARMRRSMYSSPGNHGSSSGGMVLMYGVDTVAGNPTPCWRARSSRRMSRYRARLRPWVSTTASNESSHSRVSSGSMSGSWWLNPSKTRLMPPVSHPRSPRRDHRGVATTVYTDGACSGNPGPGGWAWAVPGGRWAAGAVAHTTNQRMEITAALEAVRALEGALDVVSDSTYVVNCFRDRWWQGWLARGWRNSGGMPVANRDLWEPLIDLYRARGDITLRWVKGHGSDEFNNLVDRLAVEAALTQRARSGDAPID